MSRSISDLTVIALLCLWLGASILFAAAVAPAAFAVLPTRTLAGLLVGRVLPVIFVSGIAVGAVAIALAHGSNLRRAMGAVIVGSCAVAQLVVAPRIERVRAEIGGPIEALAPDDARRMMFGRLHAMSVGWMGVAMLAAGVIVVAVARQLSTSDDH